MYQAKSVETTVVQIHHAADLHQAKGSRHFAGLEVFFSFQGTFSFSDAQDRPPDR